MGAGLQTWYYSYDSLNRLTEVRETSNGTTNILIVTYAYDILNRRIEETDWQSGSSSTTTRYANDGQQARQSLERDRQSSGHRP
jgi:hypothetical protein